MFTNYEIRCVYFDLIKMKESLILEVGDGFLMQPSLSH